jgi:hypothetical protein
MPWPWLPEHLVGGFSIAMIREERERDIYIYIELNFTRARQYLLDVFVMFVYVAF